MNEMIERVARAIELTMFAPHELPLDADLHKNYLITATAAIDAMRVPTGEMVEAGRDAPKTPYDIWVAMVASITPADRGET